MAHRGRLNALVHTVGRSYQSILREFEGERSLDALVVDPEGGTGDVKYHLPASGTRVTPAGEIDVTIVPNPSHLEAADPVVEGRARAEQTDRSGGAGIHDPSVALPVLIHGDAAFPGQGVVAETLNLQSLEGYATGGTLHLITNNQVGYTTDPTESRSTRYSSDLAKGFDVPIVHVNADDPEAALSAVQARARLPDRVRPRLRDRPGRLPALRPQRAGRRVVHAAADGRADPAAADGAGRLCRPARRRRRDQGRRGRGARRRGHRDAALGARAAADGHRHDDASSGGRARSRRTRDDGRRGGHGRRRRPAARAERTAPRRAGRRSRSTRSSPSSSSAATRRSSEGGIDWGQAEALAYATLLEDGIPVRLSGQDAERGTFAHRHLMFHDPYTGETYAPIQHLPGGERVIRGLQLAALGVRGARVRVRLLGRCAGRLVLWEAQFGDFVNGAQIVIDQFLVAGRSKWGQTSRLTLLLPHGYEGNGPEHSSARLERFLQQGAQDNIRIANCTTAAQFFHLLRRQALDATARPLVVMTPKGLLRLKNAASTIEELSTRRVPARDPRPDRRRRRPPARALQREGLLRHRRSRRAAGRDRRRRGAAGAALPVPGRGRSPS